MSDNEKGEITKERFDVLKSLRGEAKEDFGEELLLILADEQVEMNWRERAAILSFVKGHHSSYTLLSLLQVCMRTNPGNTHELIQDYVNPFRELVCP